MQNQSAYLNKLRVVAIAMVIMLHVAAPVRDQLEYMATANWLIGAIFDGLARTGVPLFVMISGALLLGKQEEIGVFYRKRLSRLVIPFLVWGLFYAVYWQKTVDHDIRPVSAVLTVLQGPSFYHLWYLYMLIGLYLITPFMRILMQHIEKRQLEIMLLIWILFSIVLPHLYAESALWFNFPFRFGFGFHGVDTYLGYYILGYYLHKYGVPRFSFNIYILLYVGVTIAMVAGSYILYRKGGVYNPLCILNESPFVFLQACLLFEAFKIRNQQGRDWISRLANQIALLSFGMYLVHPVIIDVMDKGYLGFELDARSMDTILSIPLTYPIVFAVSFLISLAVSKIPYVRKIIG